MDSSELYINFHINIDVYSSDVVGQLGIECSQIPILGVALQDMCKVTPVCCENVSILLAIVYTLLTLLGRTKWFDQPWLLRK